MRNRFISDPTTIFGLSEYIFMRIFDWAAIIGAGSVNFIIALIIFMCKKHLNVFYKKCLFNFILIHSMFEHLVKTIVWNLIFNYLYMCAHMYSIVYYSAWHDSMRIAEKYKINNTQPIIRRKEQMKKEEMRNSFFCFTFYLIQFK